MNYMSRSGSPTQHALAARAAVGVARVLEVALAELDLTPSQYRLLAYLSKGSVATSFVAGHLSVTRPSVTALVDGAVAKGLVERIPDLEDRRRIALALSPAGREALARADQALGQRLRRLADRLPDADASMALQALCLWGDARDAELAEALEEVEAGKP